MESKSTVYSSSTTYSYNSSQQSGGFGGQPPGYPGPPLASSLPQSTAIDMASVHYGGQNGSGAAAGAYANSGPVQVQGNVDWLMRMQRFTLHASSSRWDFEIRSENSPDVLQFRHSRVSCAMCYEVWKDGVHLATLRPERDGCCNFTSISSRLIECPPGAALAVSKIRSQDNLLIGRDTHYKAYIRTGTAKWTKYVKKKLHTMGDIGIVKDHADRELGFIEGNLCAGFCGDSFLTITPKTEASAFDRLILIDLATSAILESAASPQIWVSLVAALIFVIVLFAIIGGVIAAVL